MRLSLLAALVLALLAPAPSLGAHKGGLERLGLQGLSQGTPLAPALEAFNPMGSFKIPAGAQKSLAHCKTTACRENRLKAIMGEKPKGFAKKMAEYQKMRIAAQIDPTVSKRLIKCQTPECRVHRMEEVYSSAPKQYQAQIEALRAQDPGFEAEDEKIKLKHGSKSGDKYGKSSSSKYGKSRSSKYGKSKDGGRWGEKPKSNKKLKIRDDDPDVTEFESDVDLDSFRKFSGRRMGLRR
mmetsp:Transcript_19938/g.64909  ORF Transcript_19938/g.64909 Transcript_19938/m.64909 type:complete len:238 (+) Transcript_19938:13-726(+)